MGYEQLDAVPRGTNDALSVVSAVPDGASAPAPEASPGEAGTVNSAGIYPGPAGGANTGGADVGAGGIVDTGGADMGAGGVVDAGGASAGPGGVNAGGTSGEAGGTNTGGADVGAGGFANGGGATTGPGGTAGVGGASAGAGGANTGGAPLGTGGNGAPMRVLCDRDNDNPPNSTDVVVEVEVQQIAPDEWEPAPDCPWQCIEGYDAAGGECVCAGSACFPDCSAISGTLPGIDNGFFTIDGDGDGSQTEETGWCDFATGWFYSEFGFGQFDREFVPAYGGWSALSASELASPAVLEALEAFSGTTGLRNLGGWTAPGSCCLVTWDSYPQTLTLGSDSLKLVSPDAPGECAEYVGDNYVLAANDASVSIASLEGNLGSSAGCAIDRNPMLFARRHTGLSSCREILDASLSIGTAIYMVDPDGPGPEAPKEVVCDMSNGDTIETIAIGRHGASYGNSFQAMTLADFDNPAITLAFSWYYSRNLGMLNLEVWEPRNYNCCMKINDNAGEYLKFLGGGNSELVIAVPTMNTDIAFCDEGYTGSHFELRVSTTAHPPPFWRDYFQILTPYAAPACADFNNPRFFVQRYQ